MTKVCTSCRTEQTLDNFYAAKLGKYGVTSQCKKCKTLYSIKWRHKNRDKHNAIARNAARRVKLTHTPCFFCGLFDVRILEFHHIQPRKTSGAANKTERNKCVSMCGNCHNILHYESRKRHNGTST